MGAGICAKADLTSHAVTAPHLGDTASGEGKEGNEILKCDTASQEFDMGEGRQSGEEEEGDTASGEGKGGNTASGEGKGGDEIPRPFVHGVYYTETGGEGGEDRIMELEG